MYAFIYNTALSDHLHQTNIIPFPFAVVLRTQSLTQLDEVIACKDIAFKEFLSCLNEETVKQLLESNLNCTHHLHRVSWNGRWFISCLLIRLVVPVGHWNRTSATRLPRRRHLENGRHNLQDLDRLVWKWANEGTVRSPRVRQKWHDHLHTTLQVQEVWTPNHPHELLQ